MRTGIVNLPLHGGKCPRWLFPRMKKLGGAISEAIIDEFGKEEYLRRLSNPYWFQALGCVVGFDWHSSGLTTTVCGALKEAVNSMDIGITFAGGKGKNSRKTPYEIGNSELSSVKIEKLKYASKITAKVDCSLIQDSYQLYHHVFAFTEKGKWVVIQQGLNNNYARRYHWLSDNVRKFIEEPHSAICCDRDEGKVLNMTAKQSEENRKVCVDLIKDNPKHLRKYMINQNQTTLEQFSGVKEFSFSPRHDIIDMDKINMKTLKKAYEIQPKNYEELVGIKGVGPKTVRSLAMVADVIYGEKASWKDPVKYSFAHGGKDSIPYPVDRKRMDMNTDILKNAVHQANLGKKDKLKALKRLQRLY